MIKLIASDLDGTLLLNGSQTLPPETCEQIKKLKEKGIIFVAASGRQYANLRRLFAPVQDDIAYICENGCLVFYQGKMLYKAEMDYTLGQEMLRTIMEQETAEALLSGENTSYIQPKKDSYRVLLQDVVKNNVTVTEDILDTPEAYFKISLYEEKGLEVTQNFWKEKFGGRAAVVTSGNDWLDMMPYGVNKGHALDVLLKHLQIDPSECLAFGDQQNDIEMLTIAGYGCAMEGAQEEVKKICPYHIDRVGRALDKIIKM